MLHRHVGAILIQSANPSEDKSAQFKASYGRFNQVQTQGYVTTGLASEFAVDLEGFYRRGDVFQTNIITGYDKVGKNRRLLAPIGSIPPAEAKERYYAMLDDTPMAA